MKPLRERDIERHLVKRVKELGGEVRKLRWIGRNGAPDRVVMLQSKSCEPGVYFFRPPFWVELKAPGKLATFPADAHERKQDREHRWMRMMGQRVVVIDSIEGVEELLR